MSQTTAAPSAVPDETQAAKPGVRVVRFVVDESALATCQADAFRRHAGTARQAWNWALARWLDWRANCAAYVWAMARRQAGVDDVDWADPCALGDAIVRARGLYGDREWRKDAYAAAHEVFGQPSNFQSAMTLGVLFTLETRDPDSRMHWWTRDMRGPDRHGVNRFAVSSALTEFERAVQAFYDRGKNGQPLVSKRTGKLLGLPRFRRRYDDRQGFTLQNLAPAGTDPWRVVRDGHRLVLPSIGSIRVKENTKTLRRLLTAGGRPTGARFARHAGRWTVSINVVFPADHPALAPVPVSRAKARRGPVGVDLGVKALATFSTGEVVANPRLLKKMAAKIARIQRHLDRQHRAGSPECFDERGVHVAGRCTWRAENAGAQMSATARRTRATLTRTHADMATERRRTLHLLTKALTTYYPLIGIEDLNVRGMTARAKPQPDGQGGFEANGQAAKSGLNKSVLDVGFAEFRRQLTYKGPGTARPS